MINTTYIYDDTFPVSFIFVGALLALLNISHMKIFAIKQTLLSEWTWTTSSSWIHSFIEGLPFDGNNAAQSCWELEKSWFLHVKLQISADFFCILFIVIIVMFIVIKMSNSSHLELSGNFIKPKSKILLVVRRLHIQNFLFCKKKMKNHNLYIKLTINHCAQQCPSFYTCYY